MVAECVGLRGEIDAVLAALPFDGPPDPARATSMLRGSDVRSKQVRLRGGGSVTVVYVESLVDPTRLWRELLHPLTTGTSSPANLPRTVGLIGWDDVLQRLLTGWAVLFPRGGMPRGVHLLGVQRRPVQEATTERSLIGPKEGFVEDLRTNVGLVRTRLRDPALRVAYYSVGRRSRTRVALLYLADVAQRRLVVRLRAGLRSLAVDTVRTAADVSEVLFARSLTPFPLTEESERPDKVEAALAVGRLCLLVEGSPFATLVPVTFFEFQKDSESALQGPTIVAFVRALRLGGILVAAILPALYVALLSSDVTVLPLSLAITLTTTRLGIPYPVLTETLVMMVIADVLAEATSQAASAIGNTLAIVGTLILGQMAVQARLASNLMVIVIAASVMGSFLTLKYQVSYSLRMIKYPLIVLSGVAGLQGLVAGVLILAVHLGSLKSAGVPYLAPAAPLRPHALTGYALLQPSRGRIRWRPAHWRPRQMVRARRGGRA